MSCSCRSVFFFCVCVCVCVVFFVEEGGGREYAFAVYQIWGFRVEGIIVHFLLHVALE